MINRQELLNDLKGLLKRLEIDLRERADEFGEAPEIHQKLTTEYEKAIKAERTAAAFEEWRAEQITQKAVAWILSCVFARFLEDNQLVDPPRISGPKDRLKRARDEHEIFFRKHPTQTDREYLLDGFFALAELPGGKEIFGKHNAIHVYPGWLSGDAAGELLAFFQTINPATGELVHDFTDDQWDTRFLGDLYQDLSEASRKKYALLQTPDFVETFILNRTLEPALDEFGLNAIPVKSLSGEEIAPSGFRMIDPACGSGHFLLGAFDRIFEHWLQTEPSASSRDLAQRTLNSIHGVDINPFALAIARFRLLLKAMKACGVIKLINCPAFKLNLACGDSLLHGENILHQMEFAFQPIKHFYETEDFQELRRILKLGVYHAVTANPPYITPKDRGQNYNIRKSYGTCHGKYPLNVPFMERIFQLAINREQSGDAGYTGQITANSFMKREFGKKIIEQYLTLLDLTHIIDTSGAYLPGHGTPTVILFGRNRKPMSSRIRVAMGIRGEPGTPANPAEGLVWNAILKQIDSPNTDSKFMTVEDVKRDRLSKHPWTLKGGGALKLRDFIESASVQELDSIVSSVGYASFPGLDDAFVVPQNTLNRYGIHAKYIKDYVDGEAVRDWTTNPSMTALSPYNEHYELEKLEKEPLIAKWLWHYRTSLSNIKSFGGKTRKELGHLWWGWYRWIPHKYLDSKGIVFANVATHNHFALEPEKAVFNGHAPLIKFKKNFNNLPILRGTLSLLNSSTACFWMKQVFHCKGSTVDQRGARQTTIPFEDFYDYDGTKLRKFPLTKDFPTNSICNFNPKKVDLEIDLVENNVTNQKSQFKISIYHQEEIDWETYNLYGLIEEKLMSINEPIEIKLGQRAFEIVMARKMAIGELETTWFDRHGSTPTTKIPSHWPESYKNLIERRIKAIEENPRTIGMIEQPEYKRRWNKEYSDSQHGKTLKNWMLARLESYFDFDGRMNKQSSITAKIEISLTTTSRLSEIAMADDTFMKIAELYRSRPDFDVAGLVAELVDNESVPFLSVCRYKRTGKDKRAAWERTWKLQQIEDAINTLFNSKILSSNEGKNLLQDYKRKIVPVINQLKENLPANDDVIESLSLEEWLEDKLHFALKFIQSVKEKGVNLDSGRVKQKLSELIQDAKDRLIGDIPVPPKYTTKDFQNTSYWRLRGKLDVPKERWVSFPYCEGENQSMLIAWAGYNHLQIAQAISTYYVDVQERTGGSEDPRLEVLLACMLEVLPWIKQWHNDVDPEFNIRMGDYYQGFIADEARRMGKTIEEIQAWQPPKQKPKRRKRKATRKN